MSRAKYDLSFKPRFKRSESLEQTVAEYFTCGGAFIHCGTVYYFLPKAVNTSSTTV